MTQPFKNLTEAVQQQLELERQLREHLAVAKKRTAELESQITACRRYRELSADGLDQEKIALAHTVLEIRGAYGNAGRDRASVIADAIQQFATGQPIYERYKDLWSTYFGTKNYSEWQGQRSDHEYGYGPRHGGICFSVGVRSDVRKTPQSELQSAAVEACIYFLTNIERIEAAEKRARAAA